MAQKKPLRERIREAGGLYLYINTRLIKYAGPAARGPYGPRAEPPCGHCGRPKDEHIPGPDGGLRCPEGAGADA
ncbi:hypothetical protein GCM10010910_08990 [Microbacterium nanhaiense]|uniref:Uncharacterized protein n=1 Tax=Microbacterium nanhaiense TaxID=1301026 RepID=A0ABQ2MYP4_9MICO|nr:hypothetical protein [Microbacterium nanhaiense]GGO61362.1 hypothetical protein GCM10010910_08990 [Microbacterium nanhaiense]